MGANHGISVTELALPTLSRGAEKGGAANTAKLFKCKTPQMRRNVAIGSMEVNLSEKENTRDTDNEENQNSQ